MSAEFGLVVALAAIGVAASAPMVIMPWIMAPKKRSPIKEAPFECGQTPAGEGRIHFMMQYYAYLLIFVVFDVMAIFLYAWGVSNLRATPQSSLVIAVFLGIMFIPLGYALHLAGRRENW